MSVIWVLALSTFLQFLAAFLALKLIRVAEKSSAWIFISSALFLMGFRRLIPISRIITGDVSSPPDLVSELIALIISGLLVIGVARITPLFRVLKPPGKTSYDSRLPAIITSMFILLGMVVWLDEIVDLPHHLLGAPQTPINWQESIFETVLLALAGLFIVSKTIQYVSLRKQAETINQELAKFPDENPNPILRISRDGTVLYANQGSAELLQGWHCAVGQRLPERWCQVVLGTLDVGLDREEEMICGTHVFALALAPIVDGGYVNIYGRNITDRKQAEEEIKSARAFLEMVIDLNPFAMWISEQDGTITRVNRSLCETIQLTEDEIVGQYNVFKDANLEIQGVMPDVRTVFEQHAPTRFSIPWKAADAGDVDFKGARDLYIDVSMFPILNAQGELTNVICQWVDITERKRAEQERTITIEFLRLINEHQGTRALIQSAVTFFQQQSGCQAVGVRLKEGDDYPYFEARGFPQEFLLVENSLCVRDLNGQLMRDVIGNPIIECMCGNVICGRFDPSKPFFTAHGSFWSNNTTALLASTTEADRQARTRNQCNGEGYESVALLPLISGNDRLGLLQLNDRRTGVFSPDLIALWERLAGYLAVALAKSHAEEALRESEDRYRTLFENAQIGIYRTTPDGRILAANPALIQLLGYASFEELAARNLEQEGFEPNYPRSRFKVQIEREGEVRGLDGVWTRRDNAVILVRENARAIRGRDGAILYYEGTVEDITERKHAEEELYRLNAELEQRVAERTAELSDLYNNAPCGYHSLDANGVFIRMNDTELNWLGYTREEIIGKMKAIDLLTLASVDTFQQNFPVFKARGWLENLELDMVRKDGSILSVLLNATIVVDQTGRYLMSRSTMIDYTERRRAEAALSAAQARLEAANQELEAFAYSVSHDLRTPLRAIDGFTRIILEDYGAQFDAEGQRLFNVVRSNAQKMDQLITDLLALSRITRGEMRLAPLDMTAIVQRIYQDIAPPEMQENVVFSVAPLPEAQGDATLIRQVWSNLLENALKYTRPRAERRIQVGGYTEGDMNVYYVQDNGVGFNPRYTHKLFGVFQRLHKANEFEGTGVGLAIVQRIVQRHGGKTWAEGVLNQGATFYFALPTLNVQPKTGG